MEHAHCQDSFLNRGQNKQDEALECYGRAANLYKMAKKWTEAGRTFSTVASHHSKLGNKHDAATNLVDAANCYKKSDPKGNKPIIRGVSSFSCDGVRNLATQSIRLLRVYQLYTFPSGETAESRYFCCQEGSCFVIHRENFSLSQT